MTDGTAPTPADGASAASGETRAPWRALMRAALPWAPVTVAAAIVAGRTMAAVVGKVGHAAATLDDSYIHFQYARAIAEGHPFRFESGEPITSGGTSLLWPAVLAPFWLLGARDDAIVWVAWILSFAALGGLAAESFLLSRRLAGRAAAVGAGAMTLVFGGFVWSAGSGMEVVPFAWSIARAVRHASEWSEAPAVERTDRRAAELVALAWIAALFRPEGAITALVVGATLAVFPGARGAWQRALGLGAAAAAGGPPVLFWALTGSARSTTAVAKLLPGNPYYTGEILVDKITDQARLLTNVLLDGDKWSAEFLPHGGALVAMAGLVAIAVLGVTTRSLWRAGAILVVALTMFAPCFYYTFLWNRLRYLWPFASGWIVGLACLARVAGDVAAWIQPRWRVLTTLLCGAFVGLFLSKLEWVIEDVAQSASGIDRQQVHLGRWAKASLPAGARIGVNDTGAIAYFGDHPTFDVVGLTTRDEARYWVAGAGSRFEHYERLQARSAALLPTHFIVYPEWMGLDAVLGPTLTSATVTDSTILGGQTMRAYVADWSKLGSGERPWSTDAPIVDALDVADLESEAEHAYELLGAREGEEIVHEGTAPDGRTVVDGGRTQRQTERFRAHLPVGAAARGIVRIDGASGASVRVLVGEQPAGTFAIDDDDWMEGTFDVPASQASASTQIELRAEGGLVRVFHYWFVAGQRP